MLWHIIIDKKEEEERSPLQKKNDVVAVEARHGLRDRERLRSRSAAARETSDEIANPRRRGVVGEDAKNGRRRRRAIGEASEMEEIREEKKEVQDAPRTELPGERDELVATRRRGENGEHATESEDGVLGTAQQRRRLGQESEGLRLGRGERESERKETGGESGEEECRERVRGRRVREGGGGGVNGGPPTDAFPGVAVVAERSL